MTGETLTYERFTPGAVMGEREQVLDEAAFRRWFALFPEDERGDLMPAGMVASVVMRAYSDILQNRPPGNVHGSQRFEIARLPRRGDRLVTELCCTEKSLRKERRWVNLKTVTRDAEGRQLFTGEMAIMWAA